MEGKMNTIAHWLKKYWPIIPVILILIFSVFAVMEVKAQEDLVAELATRLTRLGVPVKDVSIDSKVPFQITILLQSSTTTDHRTDEDALNEYMAYREAYLSNKFGLDLDSFIISLVNVNGDVIGWEQRFLTLRYSNPDFSAPKNLDNQATESLLREQLDFQGLQIDALTVTTGAGSEQDVQSVSIRLSASSLQAANTAIPGLIGTLISNLSKINQEGEVSLIAVCRLWVVDKNGDILLSYLYDLELGMQQWGMAQGVTDDWFPHPVETYSPPPVLPTVTPLSYPSPPVPTLPAYP
jgi:hypothetical protein